VLDAYENSLTPPVLRIAVCILVLKTLKSQPPVFYNTEFGWLGRRFTLPRPRALVPDALRAPGCRGQPSRKTLPSETHFQLSDDPPDHLATNAGALIFLDGHGAPSLRLPR
jgi:hypothetical protein